MPTLEMQIKNILEITNIRTDEYFSSDHLLVILSLLTKVAWSALRHLPWDTLFVDNNIDAYTACWYDFFFCAWIFKDANRPPWIKSAMLQLISRKEEQNLRLYGVDQFVGLAC